MLKTITKISILLIVFANAVSMFADVTIHVGDDWQSVVNQNPAGTTYYIEAGIHRLQSVYPKNGDTFIGKYGAIMKGSKLLDSASATYDSNNNVWVFSSQTQALLSSNKDGADRRCDIGNELFVDGARLFHENSRIEVDAVGEFYFDEVADEIIMFDNPNGKTVEAVVCSIAFNCNGKTNVTIENFTISQYGSVFRPIGAICTDFNSYALALRYMDISYCHSMAVGLCADSVMENCRISHNGQMGFCTQGNMILYNGVEWPVRVINSEIANNYEIQGNWGFGGEFGGCKFAGGTRNSLVENCWFHDNGFSCIWADCSRDGFIVRSNLIEGAADVQTDRAIYIEGCGTGGDPDSVRSEIYWNTLNIQNGGGILVTGSSNIDVFENAVTAKYRTWGAFDAGQDISRTPEGLLRDVRFFNNEFKATFVAVTILGEIRDYVGDFEFLSMCNNNKYIGADDIFRVYENSSTYTNYSFGAWQSLGYDTDSSLESSGDPQLPEGAVGFFYSYYGPRKKWRE